MSKFIKYDPALTPPAFSDNAKIEIKTRGIGDHVATKPWTLAGWSHTSGPQDILEYRLIRGAMDPQKPAPSLG